MRKKNKNNNENAQMQDMNTVQMDGANAALAALTSRARLSRQR